MKLSARNVLRGKIVEVNKGRVVAVVGLGVGGTTVTASITHAAVDDLKLAPRQTAYAAIKSSDVMIAVDHK